MLKKFNFHFAHYLYELIPSQIWNYIQACYFKHFCLCSKLWIKYSWKSVLTLTYLIFLSLILTKPCFASQEQEQLSPDVALAMHTSIINPITPHLVFANQTLANAWLNNMSKRLKKWIPDEFLRRRLLIVIQYESKRAGLDTGLILSLITIESKFNKYAISNSGARGLMQVMPFWVEQIGTQQQDLFDVETNIRYGCTILRYYLIKEHGDMYRALAKYNGSLGRDTYPNLVYTAYNKYWQQ